MLAGKFWEEYGYDHPETQEMGMKLGTALEKMTGCERNWKEHDVVHSKARNSLGAKRARPRLRLRPPPHARDHGHE